MTIDFLDLLDLADTEDVDVEELLLCAEEQDFEVLDNDNGDV